LFALQQLLEDVIDNKLGAALRYNMKLFAIGSVVSDIDYHLRIAITRETVILHAVHARAAELIQRRGSLCIPFLKLAGYLFD
jgi:hypothetical protein